LHFIGSGAFARSGDLSIESVNAAKEGLSTAVLGSNAKLGEPKFKGTVSSSRHPL
jgi:hypothetical protein